MGIIDRFVAQHAPMFVRMPAEVIHPHDHFLDRVLLHFFPVWITPNKVTVARIVCTPIVFFLILYKLYLLGIIAFLLVAATDMVDGSLARTRNQITEFGILFDPLADKLLIGSMVLLIVFNNYHFLLGLAVLGIEVAFICAAAIYKVRFHSVRASNTWGKMKMIAQVLAVFLTLAGLLLSAPQFFVIGAWVFGIAIGFAVMSLFAHGI